MRRYPWSLVSSLLLIGSVAHADPGEVLSFQKISDTEGNFTGVLDDLDYLGQPVENIGDLDGDNIVDLAVGAHTDDDGAIDAGAVWILFMNADGTVKAEQKISATEGNFTATLVANDLFGVQVGALGDLDGDNVMDLAVGAINDSDDGFHQGAVYILFMNTDGTVKAHQKINESNGNFTGQLFSNDEFGWGLAGLGDLDGDTVEDLVVGAPGGDGRGELWILFLDTDGTVKSHQEIGRFDGNFTGALDLGDRFGDDIVCIGDLDGDSVGDLAVSARHDDDGGTNRGALYVLFMNTDGTVKSHQKISDTEGGFAGVLDNGDFFGGAVELLDDLDSDLVPDLATAAWRDDDGAADQGAVYVLFMNTDGTVKTHQKISATSGNFSGDLDIEDEFGRSVAWLGDLDGDAIGDLAVGSRRDDDGGTNRGAVWVLFLDGGANFVQATSVVAGCGSTCATTSVDFDRFDVSNARGCSTTFQLSPELQLCVDPTTSIRRGTWLDAFDPVPGVFFLVTDEGGGSYTVDQSIAGSPCGVTTGGQLFTVDVTATGLADVGTIAITDVAVRDCANAPLPGLPGEDASVTFDATGPGAIVDLAAIQTKVGNDTDGTTQIRLSFTVPGDAVVTEVYRAPYVDGTGANAYPEYDDLPGAGPPVAPAYPPSAPWVLTTVTGSGQSDEVSERGFWYYAVFTKDACDNVSLVSNVSGGTLNYHLGDTSDGNTPGQGDNLVTIPDFSLLGANYGLSGAAIDPVSYLDVGPTGDLSVDALPTTDDALDFEDLMLLATNFNGVSRPATPVDHFVRGLPYLSLVIDPRSDPAATQLTARVHLEKHGRSVKGAHALVAFDPERLRLLDVRQGRLLEDQEAPLFFKSLDTEAGIVVDAAALGAGITFAGSGELAVLTFEMLTSDVPVLTDAMLRDRRNRPIAHRELASASGESRSDESALSASTGALGARPNPFRGATEIAFRVPRATIASLKIYDIAGRLVRTLIDQEVVAGEMTTLWDGRSNTGEAVEAGVYFSRLETPSHRESHKLLRIR